MRGKCDLLSVSGRISYHTSDIDTRDVIPVSDQEHGAVTFQLGVAPCA